MTHRIFNLGIELGADHPQRTDRREKSLALGFTSADSLDDAQAALERYLDLKSPEEAEQFFGILPKKTRSPAITSSGLPVAA